MSRKTLNALPKDLNTSKIWVPKSPRSEGQRPWDKKNDSSIPSSEKKSSRSGDSFEEIHRRIKEKLNIEYQSSSNFAQSCEKLVTLIINLEKDDQLRVTESLDLLNRIEHLVDSPNEYTAFLQAAKEYQRVAGGKLSAYMMLVAGWAAKILSLGYREDALIKFSSEKIEQIEVVEQFAEASKMLSKK